MSSAVLFANDAGGAEILSLWASKNLTDVYAVLSGPAVPIFERNLPHINHVSFDDAFLLPYNIITSTSWESTLEKQAIQKSRNIDRFCISILDHWVNYEERFLLESELVLPNEIWVTDYYANNLAKQAFPTTEVRLIENLYMTRMAQRYQSVRLANVKEKALSESESILYICESINRHSMLTKGDLTSLCGYTEEDAFSYFLENIYRLVPDLKNITVRLHPSQLARREEYNWMKYASKQYHISISENIDLCVDLSDSDSVVGMESMALATSVFLGKATVSAIPTQGTRCRLPMKKIVHLSDHVS